MKPKQFNLEKAKAGAPVMLSDGRSVRIVCFDMKTSNGLKILALMPHVAAREVGKHSESHECAPAFDSNHECVATFDLSGAGDYFNLAMAPIKREGWCNYYSIRTGGFTIGNRIYTPHPEDMKVATVGSKVFNTKEEATANIQTDSMLSFLHTVKVEWEE